jgi:hypothetical protein
MCGLRGGAAVVAVVLISYNEHGGCYRDNHEEETIVIEYFLYTNT